MAVSLTFLASVVCGFVANMVYTFLLHQQNTSYIVLAVTFCACPITSSQSNILYACPAPSLLHLANQRLAPEDGCMLPVPSGEEPGV
jgi:hypothetical protein